MITIISATNRKDSMTMKVANVYFRLFTERTNDKVKLLSLEGKAILEDDAAMDELETEFLISTDKFVFVMPEYNGSFPGILKLMIDNSDIRRCWWHKKAMMVGVADGRAGNLRGMEHMTNILHYMKVHVFYNKLPISRINEEIDEEGHILKPLTEKVIKEQIEDFLKF
jgi:chromate reductase